MKEKITKWLKIAGLLFWIFSTASLVHMNIVRMGIITKQQALLINQNECVKSAPKIVIPENKYTLAKVF